MLSVLLEVGILCQPSITIVYYTRFMEQNQVLCRNVAEKQVFYY